MKKTLEIVAQELAPLRNPVVIEGHTDAAQYAGIYSNWELSADRANAARRIMEGSGLTASRVVEVRGMADRQLRDSDESARSAQSSHLDLSAVSIGSIRQLDAHGCGCTRLTESAVANWYGAPGT